MTSGGEESHPGKTKTIPEGWCLFPATPDGKLQFQMESYMAFLRLAFHGDKIFAKTLFSMLKGKF